MKKLKIVCIDNLGGCCEAIGKTIADQSDMEMAGFTSSFKEGFEKAKNIDADLILLDAELPEILPLQAVHRIRKEMPNCGILIMGSGSPQTAERIVSALEAGAFDFLIKHCGPASLTGEKPSAEHVLRLLLPKIRAFSIQRFARIAKNLSLHKLPGPDASANPSPHSLPLSAVVSNSNMPFKIVTIGVSTGGPEALSKILPMFPRNFPVPIVIAMHMPKFFTQSMAESLTKKSSLPVKESVTGDSLLPSTVYLARGGSHLTLCQTREGAVEIVNSDEPPENNCRPSVDILFRSVAKIYGQFTLAVMLTGMGDDGVQEMVNLKKLGAITLAQDEESSVVWGMPGSAVRAGCIDEILPLDKIPGRIMEIFKGGKP